MALAAPGPAAAGEDDPSAARPRVAAVEPGGLTADEVARRAAALSPEAGAKREELRAAEAAIDQARAMFAPRLGLTARYTRLLPDPTIPMLGNVVVSTNPPGPVSDFSNLSAFPLAFPVIVDQYNVTATLSLPISDYVLRMGQGLAAATRSREAAALAERAARWKAASDARIAFYDWVRALGQRAVIDESLEIARAHHRDATEMVRAGVASRADALRADAAVAAVELAAERVRGGIAVLEERLRAILHDPPAARYALGEDLHGELAPLDLASAEEQYAEALRQRLELRILAETEESLRKQASAVRASAWPRLDAVGNASYVNPNPRFFPQRNQFDLIGDVTLQLSWSPNDTAAGLLAGRGVDARVAQLAAQREGLRDGLRVEVTQARSGLHEAEASRATTARGLRAAEESYRARRELYRQGRATDVELADAEGALTRARLAALDAQIDLRVARVKLLHAIGRDGEPADR